MNKQIKEEIVRLILQFFGKEDKNTLRAHLIKGATGSFIIKVTFASLAFATHLLLGRLLGAKGYGNYNYALSWVGILSVLAVMGLNRLLIREIAMYKTHTSWGLLRGLIKRASSLGLLVSIILSLAVLLGTWVFKEAWDPQMLSALWIALILLPLKTLARLREAAMRGLKHVVSGQLPDLVIRPALFIALFGGTYLFVRERLDASWAIGLQALATAVALFIGTTMLYRFLPRPVKEAVPKYKTKVWASAALPLLLLAILQTGYSQIDILMLGSIKGAAETGLYAAANRGARLIFFILAAGEAILGPTIASLYASGNINRLQRIITKSIRGIWLLSIPIGIGLIIFNQQFLLLFGPEFIQGKTALVILCCAQLMKIAMGAAALILIMTKYEKDAAIGIGFSLLVNGVLNSILIPRWGATGAAIAKSTSMITWNLMLAITVKRKLGIDPTVLGKANLEDKFDKD